MRRLGLRDYLPSWQAMQAFTERRGDDSPDELWQIQHPPVFTLGLNGKPEHILDAGDIPLVNIDRGGQVTYHGPGQLVIYVLIDLKRRKLGVRELVQTLENAVIALLASYGIEAYGRRDAPGVYVQRDGIEAKICALGLRVRRGRCYHGLALNLDMDLRPYGRINPCGYAGMTVTQLADLVDTMPDHNAIADQLCQQLADALGHDELRYTEPSSDLALLESLTHA